MTAAKCKVIETLKKKMRAAQIAGHPLSCLNVSERVHCLARTRAPCQWQALREEEWHDAEEGMQL